ncbi:mitotic fidelity of chromosome transmission- protein [Metarhizium acridum]|uniref:mitotic fidelity of chromosome transmission- protein n=1 Tax=Metarhizium acridum TaxID=92637 RepID=UPI001C6CCD9D|nr:mitotic fidelity of chromosome transmission- protein [Metarhizium acridum]KAG8427068.1 mitotic fidelity of chromosome transmission- protein [Metarhizium acridum]
MDSTTHQVPEYARRVKHTVVPPAEEDVRVTEIQLVIRQGPTSQPDTESKSNGNVEPAAKDEELGAWETNEGTVRGNVVVWQPSHQLYPQSDDTDVELELEDDQIAISASAITTLQIPGTTFSFAKTLHTPYMGAGVVDIPPGGEKRPKNTRTMQIVFFVHYGKVLVTVNDTRFRISTGGIWTVPRGNYYRIENDGEGPARIFFSQACETMPETL